MSCNCTQQLEEVYKESGLTIYQTKPLCGRRGCSMLVARGDYDYSQAVRYTFSGLEDEFTSEHLVIKAILNNYERHVQENKND